MFRLLTFLILSTICCSCIKKTKYIYLTEEEVSPKIELTAPQTEDEKNDTTVTLPKKK